MKTNEEYRLLEQQLADSESVKLMLGQMRRIKELEQQLAERDKQSADLVAAAKEVGDANERLAARAIAAEKQNVLLRTALGMAMDYFNGMPWASSTVVNCKEALDATTDLAGLVVCDAKPVMKVIRNEAGQVVAQNGDGGYFSPFNYVGKSFYLAKEKS